MTVAAKFKKNTALLDASRVRVTRAYKYRSRMDCLRKKINGRTYLADYVVRTAFLAHAKACVTCSAQAQI